MQQTDLSLTTPSTQPASHSAHNNSLENAEPGESVLRHNWRLSEIDALWNLPFNDLLFKAQQIHRKYFNPNEIQMSTLLSIKTGACPENCKYCSQSGHYNTELEKEKLLSIQRVLEEAKQAKEKGATRFCMGAAWRSPSKKDMPYVIDMVKQVKAMGLETCMTLGMLSKEQSSALAEAGLDYYNHNLDTSPEHYASIITTRSYQDRLDTLQHVRDAGMKVCAGGIVGLGEKRRDRAGLLMQLANLPQHLESVPINQLVKIDGTPLADVEDLDPFEFVRTIAIARIMMPASYVRLSAGREVMDESTQALCFMAGANSIFYGDKLLTTANPETDKDQALLKKLGLTISLNENEVAEGIGSAQRDDLASAEPLEQKAPPRASQPLYHDAMA